MAVCSGGDKFSRDPARPLLGALVPKGLPRGARGCGDAFAGASKGFPPARCFFPLLNGLSLEKT